MCRWSATAGKLGCRAASDSAVVPGRGNSSRSSASEPSGLWTGIRLRSNRPSWIARSARACDSAARASRSVRGIPSIVAIASAQTPWCDCGWISSRWGLFAPIGNSPFLGNDIISVPPDTTRSSIPAMIAVAAMFALVIPDPQKRSRVTPLALMSYPASSADILPRSPLCSQTCELVPHTTSSTSALSKPLRSTRASSTVRPRCCGWRWARAPLPCLPTPRGVRHASMMRASAIP